MPTPTSIEQSGTRTRDATRDPAQMTPSERLDEIAAILARGVLRLRQACPDPSAESTGKALSPGPERAFM